MKINPLVILAVSVSCGVASAEIHGYPDDPKLPGVPYVVHDPARPQPPVVKPGGPIFAKPPSDAIMLFDGTSLDAWEPGWVIKDGSMVATGKDVQSKQSFGAIQMHFEWRLPAGRKVDGQTGGNSGVFLMGLYEVQVLQSNDNPTYPDGQAGAMYGQLPPLVNAITPQGEWQSYDLAFEPPVYENGKVVKPAKLTLMQNGVFVQNGESYLGPTEHRKLASYPPTHPVTAPLRLQFHGDPMEYRNMWVRPLGSRP
ncbi:MAG: DUF1080 domain-containing protein [Luteolibacter sp.]|uniref:3-keto-disaccharide hydrolase n=1 Tax=Luteolibacter sp. TaxID=1962973 RepID=UPI0032636AFD